MDTLRIYTAGEIHSDWRDRFRAALEAGGVSASLVGPNAEHDRSDAERRGTTHHRRQTMKAITHALISACLLASTAAVALAQETEVTVEVQIATDVVDRMPVNAGSAFAADVGSLWCWTRVSGAEGRTLSHVWIHGPYERTLTLPAVGGSPWRSWSHKNIPEEWTGEWRVEIRDEEGNVLETVTFTVGEGADRNARHTSRTEAL